jgi:hypothetical protein
VLEVERRLFESRAAAAVQDVQHRERDQAQQTRVARISAAAPSRPATVSSSLSRRPEQSTAGGFAREWHPRAANLMQLNPAVSAESVRWALCAMQGHAGQAQDLIRFVLMRTRATRLQRAWRWQLSARAGQVRYAQVAAGAAPACTPPSIDEMAAAMARRYHAEAAATAARREAEAAGAEGPPVADACSRVRAMFLSSARKGWDERCANLMRRYPAASADVVCRALRSAKGHAGHAVIELDQLMRTRAMRLQRAWRRLDASRKAMAMEAVVAQLVSEVAAEAVGRVLIEAVCARRRSGGRQRRKGRVRRQRRAEVGLRRAAQAVDCPGVGAVDCQSIAAACRGGGMLLACAAP